MSPQAPVVPNFRDIFFLAQLKDSSNPLSLILKAVEFNVSLLTQFPENGHQLDILSLSIISSTWKTEAGGLSLVQGQTDLRRKNC